MEHSEQLGELASALAKAQGMIRGASESSVNPHLKSKYADLTSVWDACRKPLSENGLSVIQCPTAPAGSGSIELTTMLIHVSGQWVRNTIVVPTGGNSGVNPAQSIGSALTYARRYSLTSMVGVAPAGDDDDASSAGTSPKQQESKPVHPARQEPAVRQAQLRKDAPAVAASCDAQAAPQNVILVSCTVFGCENTLAAAAADAMGRQGFPPMCKAHYNAQKGGACPQCGTAITEDYLAQSLASRTLALCESCHNEAEERAAIVEE